jgi:hypothetical protein
MSKEEVLADFQMARDNEDYRKDGDLLFDDLLKRAKRLVVQDREGLVDALRYWMSLRDEYLTEMAIILTGELLLKELRPDLEKIREDIISRKYYRVKYTGWVDKALEALS